MFLAFFLIFFIKMKLSVYATDYLNKSSKYNNIEDITGESVEMVDLNAATVVLKKGNSDAQSQSDNDALYDVQSNMRDRFALNNENDSNDMADENN